MYILWAAPLKYVSTSTKMVIHGYRWLYMVIDGYGWLYMVIGGYRWLYMVIDR